MRVNTAPEAKSLNYEGTPVKTLNSEQELRRSVLSCMLWEDTFYESGADAAKRMAELVRKVGFDKGAAIAIEAREKMKLRHAPLFLACELAHIKDTGRKMGDLIYRVVQRADELSELLAIYTKSRSGTKVLNHLPKQVRIGLARAFRKFSEYDLAKYDRDTQIKLRDVLFLTHPRPKNDLQGEVWKRLVAGKLAMADTWENALSGGADKRATFTRLMKSGELGALALLRNLRNMIEVSVADADIAAGIAAMKVERVLPFRFISAATYAPRFEAELESAMYRCVTGVEKLPGRTALVVDTSPSMWDAKVSSKSEMDRFDAAAALAILLREVCESARVYAFNHQGYEIPSRRGFALRDSLARTKGSASCGGAAVMMANKAGYDRIVVLTDGQWHYTGPDGRPVNRFGDAKVISPAPLTSKAYMVNMAATKNGVGYGKWTAIDGWSEAIVEYIRASEGEAEHGLL